jgi:hypothetical protein
LGFNQIDFNYFCPEMKKWLAFLLLLVTVAATFYPCSREDCCRDELSAKPTNRNNQKPACNCSPFVTCGTCAGFTLTAAAFVEVPRITEEKMVHYTRIVDPALSTYTTSLLQPPRMA